MASPGMAALSFSLATFQIWWMQTTDGWWVLMAAVGAAAWLFNGAYYTVSK